MFVYRPFDNRPYIEVSVFDMEIVALLDSDANSSSLGSETPKLLEQFNLEIQSVDNQCLSTADGTKQQIVGAVDLPLVVEGVMKTANFLIVPLLRHSFILSSDFCNIFGIKLDFNTKKWFINDCVQGVKFLNTISCKHVFNINAINTIQSRSELDNVQKQKLDALIERFKGLYSIELGRTSIIEHKIDTGDAELIKQRHHVMSPYKLKILNKKLDRMLLLNVVRPSTSAWASPVLIVTKSNGEPRFCFDGRKLNQVTKNVLILCLLLIIF